MNNDGTLRGFFMELSIVLGLHVNGFRLMQHPIARGSNHHSPYRLSFRGFIKSELRVYRLLLTLFTKRSGRVYVRSRLGICIENLCKIKHIESLVPVTFG